MTETIVHEIDKIKGSSKTLIYLLIFFTFVGLLVFTSWLGIYGKKTTAEIDNIGESNGLFISGLVIVSIGSVGITAFWWWHHTYHITKI